jgi:hypothetical protein
MFNAADSGALSTRRMKARDVCSNYVREKMLALNPDPGAIAIAEIFKAMKDVSWTI